MLKPPIFGTSREVKGEMRDFCKIINLIITWTKI